MAASFEKSVKGISWSRLSFLRMSTGVGPNSSVVCVVNCADALLLGATKVKLAAPKSKYIEHLLMATRVTKSSG